MRKLRYTACFAATAILLLGFANVARADFASTQAARNVASQPGALSQTSANDQTLIPRGALEQIARPLDAPCGLPVSTTAATETPPDGAVIVNLPPAPSSLALALTAAAGLGAFHASRSVRKLHFSDLPAWYHANCPERIGHSVAFDFALANLTVCFVADIAAADPAGDAPTVLEHSRESCSRIEPQYVLPVIAPRGPPTLA